jgi:hypothetical protein
MAKEQKAKEEVVEAPKVKAVSLKEFEDFKSKVIADLNALATYTWNPDLLKVNKGDE